MLNVTDVSERMKKLGQVIEEHDDFFTVDAKKTHIDIKTTNGQDYVLSNYLYVIFVKNLGEQECLLHIIIHGPDPPETISSSQKIVVTKGQCIKLKQEGQYQESLKKRAKKYNQLSTNRFKNWAKNRGKNIWDTKQNDIIVGILLLVIGLLLGKLAC